MLCLIQTSQCDLTYLLLLLIYDTVTLINEGMTAGSHPSQLFTSHEKNTPVWQALISNCLSPVCSRSITKVAVWSLNPANINKFGCLTGQIVQPFRPRKYLQCSCLPLIIPLSSYTVMRETEWECSAAQRKEKLPPFPTSLSGGLGSNLV